MRANIWLILLSLVFLVFGLPIFFGGIYLITLGGSWYYAFAGAGLLLTAWFLFRRERTAFWIYLLTFIFTVAWALWEAGFNPWAQVPRLVAPAVLFVLMLIALPALRGGGRGHRGFVAASLILAMAAGGILLHRAEFNGTALAQQGEAAPSPSPDTDSSLNPLPAAPVGEPAPASYAMPETGADWPAYGGTHHATRYSPLDQITKENVGSLQRVWEFRTGDMPNGDEQFSNQNTPLKIGDRLFVCSALNKIIALDAATGNRVWMYDPEVSRDAIPYNATCRGLAYYQQPNAPDGAACASRIVGATLDARLIAVDSETGQPCPDFGLNGEVDLAEGIGETAPGFYSVTSPVTSYGTLLSWALRCWMASGAMLPPA